MEAKYQFAKVFNQPVEEYMTYENGELSLNLSNQGIDDKTLEIIIGLLDPNVQFDLDAIMKNQSTQKSDKTIKKIIEETKEHRKTIEGPTIYKEQELEKQL